MADSELIGCHKCSESCCDLNRCILKKDFQDVDFSLARPVVAPHLFPPKEDQVSRLSDEVLLYILRMVRPRSCLAAVACSCRRLSRLCRDESLWQRLDLSMSRVPPESLFNILSRGVMALRLNTTTMMTPILSEEQTLLCKVGKVWKLEYFDLSNTYIPPKDLTLILSGCKCLLKLSLEWCELNNCGKEIGEMVRLNTLNLAGASGLTKTDISHIVKKCTRLTEVNISWTGLTVDSVKEFCKFAPVGLKALNLAGAVKTLHNEDLEQLTRRCKELSKLDISDCWKVTGKGLSSIVQNLCHSLECLSISRCYGIKVSDIMELGAVMHLRRLNMAGHLVNEQWQPAIAALRPGIIINQDLMSEIARPTVGHRRTSIWGIACRLE